MKKIITLSFVLMSFGLTKAQIMVNDVDVNSVEGLSYIELTTVHTAKTFAYIDMGQTRKEQKNNGIMGPDKKLVEFNSDMEVLNFLHKNGWELKQAIPVAGPNQTETRYIMVRVK